MLVSADEKLDYLRSVIKVPSEVRFLAKLVSVPQQETQRFQAFYWWFSWCG